MLNFIRYLKEKDTLMIFEKHENLKCKFECIWFEWTIIRKYIQNREKEDLMKDKLIIKDH